LAARARFEGRRIALSEARPRRRISWLAFTAGAVTMLALVLAWTAWRQRDAAGDALRGAAAVVEAVPDVPTPTIPEAPRLPDAPLPKPK
jgi:hypothetical protein